MKRVAIVIDAEMNEVFPDKNGNTPFTMHWHDPDRVSICKDYTEFRAQCFRANLKERVTKLESEGVKVVIGADGDVNDCDKYSGPIDIEEIHRFVKGKSLDKPCPV